MENNSNSFNLKIFRELTSELIRNSNPLLILQIKNNLEGEEEKKIQLRINLIPKKNQIIKNRNIPEQEETYLPSINNPNPAPLKIYGNKNSGIKTQQIMQRQPDIIRNRGRELIIPEQKLPPQLQYLRPTPTPNVEIELGKLNSFLNDSSIKIIECNGPEKEIILKTSQGEKDSGVILTKEEIKQIIETFSRESKIPVQEGIFRVAIGNLIFSAIISDVIGSKFIIKKMLAPPSRINSNFMPRRF